MRKAITWLILVIFLAMILSLSACRPGVDKKELLIESWLIGENWRYGPQAIWGDIAVGAQYIFGDGLEEQYISTHNLRTGEKQRLLDFDPKSFRVSEPSIHENRIVWSSVNISEKRLDASLNWLELNWDVFLLDLKTNQVQQITTEEHAQIEPRIYGDTIVWLDARHKTGDAYPTLFDVYAYDLKTNQERRLTSTTSIKEQALGISGNLVVWSDSRHAKPVSIDHPSVTDQNNEIYVYDLVTNSERRITENPGNDCYPAIEDRRIVWWREWKVREADIFLYDMKSSQETRISKSRYAANCAPAVYQDRIVWADARISRGNTSGDVMEGGKSGADNVYLSGAAEIYLYDIGTKQETLLVPSQTESEHTMKVSGKDAKFVDRQVWLRPVICGDFILYEKATMVRYSTYAMKLTSK